MLPIRVRLTLIYSALLFLALFASGTAVVTLLRQRLNARLDEALDRRLQGVENFLIRETTAATAGKIPDELAEYASTQPEGHLIEVREAGNGILLKSDPVPYASRLRTRTFGMYGKQYDTKAWGSTEAIAESVEEIRFLFLWSSPVLLALIGLSGYWLSSRSLRPVDEMTQAARRIGAEDLAARLRVPPSNDEISRLAEAWNEMLKRLEDSFTRMQRFTADAAHELRTPLAALRTTAELSLRRSRNNDEYQQALRQVVEISHRMQALSETLLAIARGQVPNIGPGKVTTNIGELMESLATEIQPLIDDKGLHLVCNLKPVFAEVDADSIRRVAAILLDNAMKYTSRDGTITLQTEDLGKTIVLRVTDNGSGIPADELPRIFDRFYRVDASRDRQTGGFGLGLAIARQIATAHGGSLEATSAVGNGSSFALTLSKTPASGGC